MAELFHDQEEPDRLYWDRKYFTSFEEQLQALRGSASLYVGNLSFYTTEEQILEVFSKVAPVKRIIIGINRETKTPCGFCFVEYYNHEDAVNCIKYISGTHCDDRIVRTELDSGFKPGRQYGRGKSGGQVRDERRLEHDPGRGGLVTALATPRARQAAPAPGDKRGRRESEDFGRTRDRDEGDDSNDRGKRTRTDEAENGHGGAENSENGV